MAQVLVTESYLEDIGDAIREKLETQDTYKPSEMANAISQIEPLLETLSVTQNGTYTPSTGKDGFSQVNINVAGGGGTILSGITPPTSSQGNNGEIYLQYTSGYLYANGDAAFDTGIDATNVYGVEFAFKPVSLAVAYQTYLGGVLDNFTLGCNSASNVNGIYLRQRGSEKFNFTIDNTVATHILAIKNGIITFDGVQKSTYTSGEAVGTSSGNVTIFAANGGSRQSAMNFYSLILYDANGDELFNGVATENNGVDCIYDSVSNSYITSSGTITYTEGNKEIINAFAKVNGTWQNLIGTSIDDIGGIS